MASDPSDISHATSQSPRRSLTISLKPLLLLIVVVVLCGLSFLGGEKYQKNHQSTATNTTSSTGNQTTPTGGFGGGRFGNRGGGFGQVTAVSSSSITITNQRTNASTTYSITSSTTITDNGSTVTTSDIQTGDTVLVRTSGSGSTAATAIEVNPSFGGGMGGPVTQNSTTN